MGEEGREGGALQPPAVSPPSFVIYHYFATYTILLYILFFKTIFFSKFNFH